MEAVHLSNNSCTPGVKHVAYKYHIIVPLPFGPLVIDIVPSAMMPTGVGRETKYNELSVFGPEILHSEDAALGVCCELS